ncbi:MAG: LLM class flavin-dependent oxidoreductase [Candidatus Thorarchaeota archaeon]
MDKIWFGLHDPISGVDFKKIEEMALAAEKHGFDIVTVIDHFLDVGFGWGPPLESWTTLAGLAAVTSKIRIGPLVSCYAYRRPTVLAKMAATIDAISHGRFVLGIGAGNNEEEFTSYLGKYPSSRERLMGLEDTIRICQSMFTEEVTSYSGKVYNIENVRNGLTPIQEKIPLLIGGGGEKVTFNIVAKYADISHFNPWFTEDIVDRKLQALKKHCNSLGRNYDEIRKGIGFSVLICPSKSDVEPNRKRLAKILGVEIDSPRMNVEILQIGTTDEIAEVFTHYIDKGFSFFGLTIIPYNTPEQIEILSKDIISQVR